MTRICTLIIPWECPYEIPFLCIFYFKLKILKCNSGFIKLTCKSLWRHDAMYTFHFIYYYRLHDKIYKIINFMEFTVPNMLPQAFRRYFRLRPDTVNKLIHFLSPSPRLQHRQNVRAIPIWKKVYMTLAYLGTQASTLKCVTTFISHK